MRVEESTDNHDLFCSECSSRGKQLVELGVPSEACCAPTLVCLRCLLSAAVLLAYDEQ